MVVAAPVKLALRLLLALWLLALLSGCGTLNATFKDNQGRDVMLLGHDPVAYFTMGKPMRGYPTITATHDLAADDKVVFTDVGASTTIVPGSPMRMSRRPPASARRASRAATSPSRRAARNSPALSSSAGSMTKSATTVA